MDSSPITLWQSDKEKMETVTDLIFLGSKITADDNCSHEIKRHLLLGRKSMTNLDGIFKSRDITLPTKVRLVKAMVFPVVMYGCDSWTIKMAEHQRIDAFWTVLEKTLGSPLDSEEIKPVNPSGNQSWTFIGRTDAEAPILWPPDAKNWKLSGCFQQGVVGYNEARPCLGFLYYSEGFPREKKRQSTMYNRILVVSVIKGLKKSCIYVNAAWEERSWYYGRWVVVSCSLVSNSLRPHGLQGARVLCPSLSLTVCSSHGIESMVPSNHLILCCPLVLLLSIFPSIRAFPMSWLFTSNGQTIGALASASVLPMNIQGWFALGMTGLILSKGLSRVFSTNTIQRHQFFGTQAILWSISYICT